MFSRNQPARPQTQQGPLPSLPTPRTYRTIVHLETGERITVPVTIDCNTGHRREIVPAPSGFVPQFVPVGYAPPQSGCLEGALRRCLSTSTLNSRTAHPVQLPQLVPIDPNRTPRNTFLERLNNLEQPAEQQGEEQELASHSKRLVLATKTVDRITTKLELHKIADWQVDFTAAIGRTDPEAHALLSQDPEALAALAAGAFWASRANERLAIAIDACLDKCGENVEELFSRLRDAARTNRPRILLSGTEIFGEISAHHWSLSAPLARSSWTSGTARRPHSWGIRLIYHSYISETLIHAYEPNTA